MKGFANETACVNRVLICHVCIYLKLSVELNHIKEISADNAEQYSRRNCLRISDVPENNDEVTDNIVLDLATAIDADIKLEDIDRRHRLGKPKSRDSSDDTPARPRDMIVKFSTYRARQKVYKARALTKQRVQGNLH